MKVEEPLENMEEEEEIEDVQVKKSSKKQKNKWDDWWRGVTMLKEKSAPPKPGKIIPKKKKNEDLLGRKNELQGSIGKKRKIVNKKKTQTDGLKQLTVLEMIKKCEEIGVPKLGGGNYVLWKGRKWKKQERSH